MFQPALETGSLIGGYRIVEAIGWGGMAVVYRAEQSSLGRQVALKVMAERLSRDERFRRRFVRESRIAASLDHPHVLPIFEAGEHEGTLFIAMQFVPDRDLGRLLRDGPLDVAQAVRLTAQVAAALDAAHERGLVHRDVKPANVLVARAASGWHAYLTDFGVSARHGSHSSLTGSSEWVGSVDYVAPEQVRGGQVDACADIYSLGCLLHEALTGKVPFPRDNEISKLWAHMRDEPLPVSATRGVPMRLDRVVARAMAKSPADRYQSAGELAADASDAVDARADRSGSAAATRVLPPPGRWRRRRRWVVPAAALVAAAAVAALFTGPLSHGQAHRNARHVLAKRPTRPAHPARITVPANDAFLSAKLVSATGHYRGNLERATAELGEPPHGGVRARHSVWFKYRASSYGRVAVDTDGSKVDTTLAVYTGQSVTDLVSLKENDDSHERRATRGSSALRFDTQPGLTYYVALDAPHGMCRTCSRATRGSYAVGFSDGSIVGKGVWLSVNRGQSVASVRAHGLEVVVGTRRGADAKIELILGARQAQKLGLVDPVIARTSGSLDYKQRLPATLLLSPEAQLALAGMRTLVATLRLTLLREPYAPHHVLQVPLRLPN